MAAIRDLKLMRPANVKRTIALPVRKPNAWSVEPKGALHFFDPN